MRLYTSFCIVSIILLSHKSYGQSLDSLYNALKVYNSDTELVRIYDDLSSAYWGIQWDSSAKYAQLTLQKSIQINDTEGIAMGWRNKGVIYDERNMKDSALNAYHTALRMSEQIKNQNLEANIYDNLGILYQQYNYDSALHFYYKAIDIYKSIQQEKHVSRIQGNLSFILGSQKKYKELAALYESIIPTLEANKNYLSLARVFSYMGINFSNMYEHEKGLEYSSKALVIAEKSGDITTQVLAYLNHGKILGNSGNYDSAQAYFQTSYNYAKPLNLVKNMNLALLNIAEIKVQYFRDYDTAATILKQIYKDTNDVQIQDGRLYYIQGLLHAHSDNPLAAAQSFEKALKLFNQNKEINQSRLSANQLLKASIVATKNPSLLEQFLILDSLNNESMKLENNQQFFELETKYKTAEKDVLLKASALALEQSKNRTIIISALAIILIGTAVFTIWYYRNKQKSQSLIQQNQLLELQQSLNQMELAHWNSQLNPHEIKNVIAGLTPELITKAPNVYKNMVKLLNVTRASLTNSFTESIHTQLQQADDYLHLQQNITPYHFTYEIDNKIENIDFEIPRLLIKNLVENSVKHGIYNKQADGYIRVLIASDNTHYIIKVLDNGANKQGATNNNNTGIGFKTYQKIFTYLNQKNEATATLELTIEELCTTATVRIPHQYIY